MTLHAFGILFGSKNGIIYNMDDPWKHEAEWKKLDTRDHILHDSVYTKRPE